MLISSTRDSSGAHAHRRYRQASDGLLLSSIRPNLGTRNSGEKWGEYDRHSPNTSHLILGDADTHVLASGSSENLGIQTVSISYLTMSSSLQQCHQTQQYQIEQYSMPSLQPLLSAKDLFSVEMLKIKMREWRQRIHLT